MTITDQRIAEFRSKETFSSLTYAGVFALLTLTMPSQATVNSAQKEHLVVIRDSSQSGTHQTINVRHDQITELELFSAINAVFDNILTGQVDLDPDIKKKVYSNLWDLYE